MYGVAIRGDTKGQKLLGSCTCPFEGFGKWCKHLYAVGLLHIDEEAEVSALT
jgi:uncharacterized Zn finger protein